MTGIPEFVAILGSVGIGAIVSAIVSGFFSKRKISAEATEIITKAAAGVVTNLQNEIERQTRINKKDRDRHRHAIASVVAAHEKEMQDFRRVLQLHLAWDAIAISKLAEIGIELPPAPPLTPPSKPTDRYDGVDFLEMTDDSEG